MHVHMHIYIQDHANISWMKRDHRWEKFMHLSFNATEINFLLRAESLKSIALDRASLLSKTLGEGRFIPDSPSILVVSEALGVLSL